MMNRMLGLLALAGAAGIMVGVALGVAPGVPLGAAFGVTLSFSLAVSPEVMVTAKVKPVQTASTAENVSNRNLDMGFIYFLLLSGVSWRKTWTARLLTVMLRTCKAGRDAALLWLPSRLVSRIWKRYSVQRFGAYPLIDLSR
jgi:hypothetical protein